MTTEHSNDPTPPAASPPEAGIADPLIRITTALAVAAVAAVAAVISYRHAYELVTTHGETGLTARLLPFTIFMLKINVDRASLWPDRCHRDGRCEPLSIVSLCIGALERNISYLSGLILKR